MKYIYLLFCFGAFLLTACKELVDVDAPTNQLGTEQVFESPETANAALAGLYAELRDGSIITGAGFYTTGTLLASYTDELDCYTNDQDGILDIYRNLQQETNTVISNIWNTAYGQVYYANSIIYGATHSTKLSDTEKNQITGEALLIRSLIYFYLQQVFGDIPYSTSLDYEYNRNLTKTDASAVLEQLETDVTEAVSLLEDEYRDSERIYLNRKAAQLLLARICLLREEWVLAEQTASTILQSPLYEFEEDISEVFHKTGQHILWQLEPENDGDATEEASFYYFTDAVPSAYTLAPDLVNSFDSNDLRRQEWMAEVSFDGESWYRPFKYKNKDNGANDNEYSVVFRLAEPCFIMAEALIRQNRQNEALPYLNAIRERAGLTALTSLSDEDFINELLAEKRREFFTEFGHRFLDLKRTGHLNELRAVKTNWEDYMQVWPLPQNELLLNPNLTPQNASY
ncbi:RagB/SusD family nutrient uptake outer membrane protein [Draconibacterium orientale]|uniref:RagB/SusD family nutrient uptake outer membrane protein n=1 Tax=Draconibacterium orientale TaxID=1168034 RepID=UPI002ABE9C5F|nr:RagB/SusD family nutrient uptake outer membrane protein [Draconibacterium orientale]